MNRKPITNNKTVSKPTIAIVGAGSLATFMAVALHEAGYTITEIVVRNSPRSSRRARSFAARVGAQVVTANTAALDSILLWFCVPDREIYGAASVLVNHLATSKQH